MISVVLATHDNEAQLAHALTALVPGAADGLVREVLVVDGGSSDATHKVADAAGCEFEVLAKGEGARFAHGAALARKSPWLLFLTASTVLEHGWHQDVQTFIERVERSGQANRCAAAFRLKLDAFGFGARLSEFGAMLRSRMLAMPNADQGLLISRRFYEELGGHRDLAGMADFDLVRRIGRSRIRLLRSSAIAGMPGGEARTGLRRSAARMAVAALRLPPALAARLHG
ncbi:MULTISPECIES: glycosyltransferase [unclassified Pannonibacter]|uniref:glycosyltransferase n=1 Tax=unclassified Pannonibacter TaxID=2627228 RepID=UPI001645B05E|nr:MULTISPECIES: glycosyltransferase [unclassified Pannonibacter]